MKNNTRDHILKALDERYGVTKEGFLHFEKWQLLLAIMLSAQSTDQQVYNVLPKLWERFTTINDMADATEEEISQYIKSIGLYKSKAKNMKNCCIQICTEFGGAVPTTVEELITLSGVGRKSATLFLADAYDIPGVTVDTHVLRISKRLGWAVGKTPVQVERELMEVLPEAHWNRINFQLIYLGRELCTARKCRCEQCFLGNWCEKLQEK